MRCKVMPSVLSFYYGFAALVSVMGHPTADSPQYLTRDQINLRWDTNTGVQYDHPSTNSRLFSAGVPGTFEGDMNTGGLTSEKYFWSIIDKTKPKDLKKGIKVGKSFRWPGGITPYQFDRTASVALQQTFTRAVQYLGRETCVKMRPKTGVDSLFVTVSSDTSACGVSDVGRLAGGGNQIKIGSICENALIEVIHEIMHTLGFVHEQSRPDRDEFVAVEQENVRPFAFINFQKYIPVDVDIYEFAYDFHSIMHYPQNAFSKDEKELPTIIPKQQVFIGQNKFVSRQDLARINHHYSCPNPYQTFTKPCAPNLFRCKFVDGCISSEKVCDGQNDCGDSSDERGCQPKDQFKSCPTGWSWVSDACYKYIGKRGLSGADAGCRAENKMARLPVFRHEADYKLFLTFAGSLNNQPTDAIALAGYYAKNTNTFKLDETTIPNLDTGDKNLNCQPPYMVWGNNETIFEGGGERCLVLNRERKMNFIVCDDPASYNVICQLESYDYSQSIESSLFECPKNWKNTKTYCYKHIGVMQFQNAAAACEREARRSHLPVFKSPKHLDDMLSFLSDMGIANKDIPILVSGRVHNLNTWRLPRGGAPIGQSNQAASCNVAYLNWAQGEPNNAMGEDKCLAMDWGRRGMMDVPCDLSKELVTICQIPLFDICNETACPEGWTRRSEVCYKYMGLVDTAKAEAICRNIDLPVSFKISSQSSAGLPVFRHGQDFDEFIDVLDTFQMIPNLDVYLGGALDTGSGKWMVRKQGRCTECWCNSTAQPTQTTCEAPYLNWSWQEPDNVKDGAQRCLARSVLNKMSDVWCYQSSQNLVCQIPFFDVCSYSEKLQEEKKIVENQKSISLVGATWLDSCLRCICNTATPGCVATAAQSCTDGQPCGLYKLTIQQWSDVKGAASNDKLNVEAFKRCAIEKSCAEDLLKQYFLKYALDCAEDGPKPECEVLTRIYHSGPLGCRSVGSLSLWGTVDQCLRDRGK